MEASSWWSDNSTRKFKEYIQNQWMADDMPKVGVIIVIKFQQSSSKLFLGLGGFRSATTYRGISYGTNISIT